MKIHRLRSRLEFLEHQRRVTSLNDLHFQFLKKFIPEDGISEFKVPGFSYPAGVHVDFSVDFMYSSLEQGVNWRERVICPISGLNNRMRAAVHLFDIEMDAYPDSTIYLTEKITPLYRFFSGKFSNVLGSEFLGSDFPAGHTNGAGIQNENLCSLSFEDGRFDSIVSLDVLEHIPDYLSAFAECSRCLRSGGKLMWSAPFARGSETNIVRAVVNADGTVTHLLKPEFHGDPMTSDGVLCYTDFGWEVFSQLRSLGFSDAYAIPYQSAEFGYLGSESLMFFAIK